MRRALLILLTGAVSVGLLAGCAAPAPTLTDIPSALAAAKTPDDHRRLATFFEDKAKLYEAEATQHNRLADQYLAGAGTGGRADRGSAMAAHCRQLRDQFMAAADQARMLAKAHRDMGEMAR